VKILLNSLLLFFVTFLSVNALAQKLVTEHFEIIITSNCAEGEVTCNNVTYDGKNRKNGSSIHLKGKTLHSLCADGVTPCSFQGYAFTNGNIDYIVHENGLLEVVQNNSKVLINEKGEWQN